MKLIKKLVLKDLLLNKKRTIATIVGIILSLALFVSVLTMYISMVDGLKGTFKKTEGDYHVAFFNVKADQVDSFKNNEDIEKINAVKTIGYANIENKQNNEDENEEDKESSKENSICLEAIQEDSFDDLALELKDGHFPTNEKEILITNDYKVRNKISIGDTISFDLGKKVVDEDATKENKEKNRDKSEEITKIVDTKKESFKVVGVFKNSILNTHKDWESKPIITVDNGTSKDVTSNLYARYKKDAIKKWNKVSADILGLNESDLCLSFERTEYTDSYDEIHDKAKYEFYVNEHLISLEKSYFKNGFTYMLVPIIVVMIALVMVGTIVCIKNSFDISVTEKTKQNAMLKSIGATKSQIRKSVLFEASILMLIAIPFGIGVGLLASDVMLRITNYYVKDVFPITLKVSYSYQGLLIAVLLVLVTIYLSALLPAIKSSKISIIEGIKNSDQIKLKAKKMKTPKYIKKLFGIGGVISRKNMKRNKKKYRKIIIAISISVFLFITIFTMLSFVYKMVEEQYKLDYNVRVDAYDKKSVKDLYSTLDFDNIKKATIMKMNSRRIKDVKTTSDFNKLHENLSNRLEGEYKLGEDVDVMCLDKAAYDNYIKELGLNSNDIKDKAILINYVDTDYYNEYNKLEKVKVYDYNVGDKVELKSYDEMGEVEEKGSESDDKQTKAEETSSEANKTLSLQIGHVTEKKPFGMTKDSVWFGGTFVISEELYDKSFKDDEMVSAIGLYLSSDADKLTSDIKELYHVEEDYGPGLFISNFLERERMTKNIMKLISLLIYGFITVLFIIGVTNIFNTIISSMQLRKREFATLKSVGMTKKEFRRMIRLESIFIGVKALIIGFVLGAIVIVGVTLYAVKDMDVKVFNLKTIIEFTPFGAIAGAIVIVIAIILLIMSYSLSRINKQNIIETIRNDNI